MKSVLPLQLCVALTIAFASSPPSAQTPALRRLHDEIPSAANTNPISACADLDGDGDLDLLSAARPGMGHGRRVLRNDGTGVFLEVVGAVPFGAAEAQAMAAGDVDGDGSIDVVEGNGGQNVLLRNDGAGGFAEVPGALPSATDFTVSATLFDAEGDGDLDLVLGNLLEPCRLLRNDGTGAFVDDPAALFPVKGWAAAGDLNGDQQADLVFSVWKPALTSSGEVLLGVNQGATFSEASFPDLVGPSAGAALVADLDQDSDLDVAAGWSEGIEVFANDGSAGFTSLGELDAHPFLAYLVGSASADLDADGDADLVSSYFEHPALLHLNGGSGAFSLGAGMPTDLLGVQLHMVDVDGDADVDLINDARTVVLNDGTGTLVRADGLDGEGELTLLYGGTDGPRSFALGDADADGDEDLFTAAPYVGRVLLNTHGAFSPSPNAPEVSLSVASSTGRPVVDAGDVDLDGDLDVLFATPLRLLLGDGAGGFASAPSQLPALGTIKSMDLRLLDLDLDGDLDALIPLYTSSDVLLRNTGGGTFVDDSAALPAWASTRELALFDADQDGDVDVARANFMVPNEIQLNDGAGTLVPLVGALSPDMNSASSVDVADVNADGNPDLAFASLGLDENGLHMGIGGGLFFEVTGTAIPSNSPATRVVRFGDVDLDGAPDLFFGAANLAPSLASSRLLRNDGGGFFALAPELLSQQNGSTYDAGFVDLDLDGDVDLLTVGDDGVLWNVAGQVARTAPARLGKDLTIQSFGPPGDPWLLGVSAHALPVGIPIAGFDGPLMIDPGKLITVAGGLLGANGQGQAVFAVPSVPALEGAFVYVQGLSGAPTLRFTNLERIELFGL